MRTLLHIIFALLIVAGLNNCTQDIFGTEENYRKELADENVLVKDTVRKLSFKFTQSELFIPYDEILDLGELKKDMSLERELLIMNSSGVDTITIYSLVFDSRIKIRVLVPDLSITLPPGGSNYDNRVIIEFNTNGVPSGDYDVFLTTNNCSKLRMRMKITII